MRRVASETTYEWKELHKLPGSQPICQAIFKTFEEASSCFDGDAWAKVFQQWWTAVWASELEGMRVKRFKRTDAHCIIIAGLHLRSLVAGAKVLAIESGGDSAELILVEVE